MKWQEAAKLHAEYRAKLYPSYPLTFARPPEPGIQVDRGWYRLVSDMAERVEAILIRRPDLAATFRFSQIKEKYAKLTCYYGPKDPEIEVIVDKAGRLSQTICEECGSRGEWRTTTNQWEYIACPLHVREDDDSIEGWAGG